VLLPWCEVDAWRASLLIATQMQDCKTLKHLLVDTAEWREHDRFRVELTGDEVHPSAKRSLELAVQVYKKVTPFRERGEGNEELLNAPFLKDGPWQVREGPSSTTSRGRCEREGDEREKARIRVTSPPFLLAHFSESACWT